MLQTCTSVDISRDWSLSNIILLFWPFIFFFFFFCNAVHFSYIRSKLKHKLPIKDSYRSTQAAQQYIIVKNMLMEEASQAYKLNGFANLTESLWGKMQCITLEDFYMLLFRSSFLVFWATTAMIKTLWSHSISYSFPEQTI